MLRLVLLLLGLLTLIGLVWHIGPDRIVETSSRLGPLAIVAILLPSLLMYLLEAYGWRLTLGVQAARLSFFRLLSVRTAGELVNLTTPVAYVGGEPLKAYLLRPYGISLVDGLASVVLARTVMTITLILFILLAIGLAVLTLGADGSRSLGLAAVLSVGLLAFGTGAFVLIQSRGLFTVLLSTLRAVRLRIRYLEEREQKLRDLDTTISTFYTRQRGRFALSALMFFFGWMAEALEVYVILYYLGGPIDAVTSIAICGLSVLIKGGTFFIPGSLGAQEAGNFALLLTFGYPDTTGITFALLRRLREVVWIVIGLACLAALGGWSEMAGQENAKPS